jgi:hypothetical protein
VGSTSHLHPIILHTTRALASTINLYNKFWRRCQGIVQFFKTIYVWIDFIFLLVIIRILFFCNLFFYVIPVSNKKKKISFLFCFVCCVWLNLTFLPHALSAHWRIGSTHSNVSSSVDFCQQKIYFWSIL